MFVFFEVTDFGVVCYTVIHNQNTKKYSSRLTYLLIPWHKEPQLSVQCNDFMHSGGNIPSLVAMASKLAATRL